MSLRKELGEIRQERRDLMRRAVILRRDLDRRLANIFMYARIADQVLSLVGRLIGGRQARRKAR
jgi:hypothetical protein